MSENICVIGIINLQNLLIKFICLVFLRLFIYYINIFVIMTYGQRHFLFYKLLIIIVVLDHFTSIHYIILIPSVNDLRSTAFFIYIIHQF